MGADFEAYLFDLDGTLIDSIALILASYHHTRRVHFGDELPDAFWIEGIGIPLRAQLERIARNAEELEALIETYRTHNHAHHDAMVRAYDGAADSVRALRARGAKLAVVTSKMRRGTRLGLRLAGLEDTFDAWVCADDVVRGKPDPEPVRKALDALGVAADGAVFVGDSPHDLLAAKAAGTASAAATWGPFAREALAAHTPDFWLDRPIDVLAIGPNRRVPPG